MTTPLPQLQPTVFTPPTKPGSKMVSLIQDRSYGIIALRLVPSSSPSPSPSPSASSEQAKPTTQNTQVLLIKQRTIYSSLPSYWTFPKGHPEYHDSSVKHTAIRELHEETNLTISLDDILTFRAQPEEAAVSFSEVYENPIRKVGKEVRYWAALVPGEQKVKIQEKEIEEARWCNWEEAKELITFGEGKKILRDVGVCLDEGPLALSNL
ncbi:hypothetical protein G7Y89_g866 [Cudoniella acicularis]|uniref:Nudix hydrolase domain-containing protein n=1 Tax=Cudoniella acicularis TaxID=354080 RepID=A0A8H4RXE2_9HELO|nr:hypothetical protein G7Y89_g866 [Cudoniella acicularis]